SGDTLLGGTQAKLRDYSTSAPTLEETEHPVLTGARKFTAGALADAANQLSSFTSPVSIALMGAGAAGKLPGAVGKAAKAAEVGAGATFAAQGAKQAYEGAKSGDVSQTLAGAGQGLLGAAGAASGLAPSEVVHPHAQAIIDSVNKNGGVTWSLHHGDMDRTNNYAVSLHPETTTRIRGELMPHAVTDFIAKHEDLLAHPQATFGVWKGPDGHYMEVSAVTPNKNSAIKAGQRHNQVEIFNLRNHQNIPTGGTGGVTDAPVGNIHLQEAANTFNLLNGRPEIGGTYLHVDPRATDIADAYEAMAHAPDDPRVQASYAALKNDVKQQWDYATKALGYTFEPWNRDGQPYKNSREMMDDVAKNKHLYFFQGGDMPADHPMAEIDPQTVLSYNDMFRAVHDLYGYAAHGFEFGPRGEENAWFKHQQMFSDEAIPALTTETRGQNSWVNFGPHMRSLEDGHVLTKGEDGYIPPQHRPYAEQKAGLLPEEFYGRGEADRFADLDAGPPKEYVALKHYADQKVQGDVLSGDKRATSPETSRNEQLRSQLPDFQPAVAFYRDGELLGRHPSIAARKFEYPVAGRYALAEIESNPIWNDAQQQGQELGLQQGMNPHEAWLYSLNYAEKAIRDEGYDGYYSKQHPADVRLFGDVPVNQPTGAGAMQQMMASQGGFARLGQGRKGLASGRGAAKTVADAAAPSFVPPENLERGIDREDAVDVNIPLDQLTLHKRAMERAGVDIDQNRPSRTEGPVDVFYDTSKKQYLVADGQHRVQEAIRRGDKSIPAKLWSGYSDYIAPVYDEKDGYQIRKSAASAHEAHATNSDPLNLLMPHEKEQAMTKRLGTQLVDNLASLPPVEDFAEAAKAGAIGKNWYQRSQQAFAALHELAPDYFKPEDKNRFANVVAATSPQQGVYMNLREALTFWQQWRDAGRPMTKEALLQKMGLREDVKGKTLTYRRLRGVPQEIDPLAVMGSKLNNVVRALNNEDLLPATQKKYYKVGNFARNLNGLMQHVTNDSWMGVFGGQDEMKMP